MGRQKAAPKKNLTIVDPFLMRDVGFRPVVKKRKNKQWPTTLIFNVTPPQEFNKEYYLGDIIIGTTNNVFPTSYDVCKIRFVCNMDGDEPETVILEMDDVSVVIRLIVEADFLKDIVRHKVFTLSFLQNAQDVLIQLFCSSLPCVPRNKTVCSSIRGIFYLLYGISSAIDDTAEKNRQGKMEISNLYKSIKESRTEQLPTYNVKVQHDNLKPKLRPYQEDAVRWMIYRESLCNTKEAVPHPSYTPLKLKSGIEIYYNQYSGSIYNNKPLVSLANTGGILADEMGLGKTVEVLSCILNHPKPNTESSKIVELDESVTNQSGSENEDLKSDPENSSSPPSFQSLKIKNADIKSDLDNSSSPSTSFQYSEVENKDEQSAQTSSSHCFENKPVINNEFDIIPDIINPEVNDPSPDIIDIPRKKRKAITTPTQGKRAKHSNDLVKSKKSLTRQALEKWYNMELNEMSVTSRKVRKERNMECICGQTTPADVVKCVKCEKYQHKNCLGYEEIYGDYICPQCWANEPLIESRATLIITPSSIKTQWVKEIKKHIRGGLKVLEYNGIRNTVIYPVNLKDFDVVITTYQVLQHEIHFTENVEVQCLRNKRRYSAPGNPLVCVNWWRLCLDEAQTVEIPSSIVSTMTQKLYSHYRWAVTGTPISKDVSDLFGLVSYLQITPYNDLETWKYLLYLPYLQGNPQPMYTFLSDILWRNSKADVINQINIPDQTFEEHYLEFSAVEKFFYQKEHELSCDLFLSKVSKFDSNLLLDKLNKHDLKIVLAPLLTLRQVCTHPNTIRGRYLATKKQVTNMKDLLDALILKNTTDSEESLRQIVSALNGIAGIYLLMKKPKEAIEQYRKALQLTFRFSEDSKEAKLTVDKLQVIHTMHNLADALEIYPNVEPTLRDGTLRKDCEDLEQKYIGKFMIQAGVAYDENKVFIDHVEDFENKFILNRSDWYCNGLEWVYISDLFNELQTRIINAMANVNGHIPVPELQYYSMIRMLNTWDEDIMNYRTDVYELLDKIYTFNSEDKYKISINQEIIPHITDCHLRPQKTKAKKGKCLLCLTNDKLLEYESKLFSMKQKATSEEDISLTGSWKPTVQELIFKSLYTLIKAKNGDENWIKDGDTHCKIIETMRKEFKEIRKFWTYLDQQICAHDELSICKIRLQLKENAPEASTPKVSRQMKNLSYKLENKLENIHLLSVQELDYRLFQTQLDEIQGMSKLENYLGTQSYLETLRKQQYEGVSPDPCPICKNSLEQHWSILPCGHSYCLECIQTLLENTHRVHGEKIQCSVCRHKHNISDISYIKAGQDDTTQDDFKIVGNFSTKIEAIIKLILQLRAQDPNVKVLLFSTWNKVLERIKMVMDLNKVNSVFETTSTAQKRIEKFKDKSENVTVLLLPLSLGSKGLNLIEATHVILVEPLLNPSDELQAIGRVHRIGQTKPTVVHKFIIRNTIEESIHQATTSNADNWDKCKVTLRHLSDLFIMKKCDEEVTDENNVEDIPEEPIVD